MSDDARSDRWAFLVNAAFRLDAASPLSGEERNAVSRTLDEALEVFSPGLDPVEDFEGYAVRRLLLSFRAATQRRQEEPGTTRSATGS